MSWHWINPETGAGKAAQALRPGGTLAVFWNVAQPPQTLAAAFSAVYARVLPDSPLARMPRDPLAAYEPILTRTAEGIRQTAAFRPPCRWQVDWEHDYTTAQWLEQVPTFGGHSQLAASQLDQLLAGIAAAIDADGGSFTARYAAVAITATRQPGVP